MIEVVTVWAPRPSHPKWRDYMPLLELQASTVKKAGHRHVVVTDLQGVDLHLAHGRIIKTQMQQSLMHAILEGQIAYVEQWDNSHPFVLVDIDCVVCQPLEPAFNDKFDVLLTNRANVASPIQNGAMYFNAGSKSSALSFLNMALSICQDHWGGDQEAISQAVEPVPHDHKLLSRHGGRFLFKSCEQHNFTPKMPFKRPKNAKYIAHFKGEMKDHAAEFVRTYINGDWKN